MSRVKKEKLTTYINQPVLIFMMNFSLALNFVGIYEEVANL